MSSTAFNDISIADVCDEPETHVDTEMHELISMIRVILKAQDSKAHVHPASKLAPGLNLDSMDKTDLLLTIEEQFSTGRKFREEYLNLFASLDVLGLMQMIRESLLDAEINAARNPSE